MKSLFDSESRAEIVHRLEQFRPDLPHLWGKMSAAEVVCHLADAMRLTFGDYADYPMPKGFFTTAFFKWMVIDSPMPWPKGTRSMPQFFLTKPGDFAQDLKTLMHFVERFEKGPNQKFGFSPGFGELTPAQWSRLSYRHCDHHLRQFGL